MLERVNGNDALKDLSLEEGSSNDDTDLNDLLNPVKKQSDKNDGKDLPDPTDINSLADEEKDEDFNDLIQENSQEDEENMEDETDLENFQGNLIIFIHFAYEFVIRFFLLV